MTHSRSSPRTPQASGNPSGDRRWRPQRSVNTDLGRTTFRQWLDEMLATPAREFPEFPVALATITSTTPGNAIEQLRARVDTLTENLAAATAATAAGAATVPRIFLIEDEYRIAVMRTELQWTRSLIEELRAGTLTWSEEWLRSFVAPDPVEPG